MDPSDRLSCEIGSFSHPCKSQIFTVRGFEAFFSGTGTLGYKICLALWLFFLVYLHRVWDRWGPPATALPAWSASLLAAHPLCPRYPSPPSLHECFFFNSLVVRLPYSLIFRQFWLLFVFKLIVILLLFV